MKTNYRFNSVLCAAGILLAASSGFSAQDLIVMRFNAATNVNNWVKWWGSAPTTMTFDQNNDAGNNVASGSMKTTVQFNLASYGGDNQFALRGALSGDGNLSGKVIDATKYDRIEFDLSWDPNSPTDANGNMGTLDVGLVPTDSSQVWFPGLTVTNMGGFQHISMAITTNMDQVKLATIGGVVFKMWSGNATTGFTGTASFWLDNIKLVPKGFITDFDSDGFFANGAFWNWWGGAARTVEWDPLTDVAGDIGSGALKISVNFTGTGDNQYSEGMSFSGHGTYNGAVTINPADYASLDFDLRWDPASTLTLDTVNNNGDPNGLGLGLGSASGWAQTWIPNADQPKVVADGAWHHISVPLNAAWPQMAGLIFKKYFNTGAQFTGTMVFWMDNIRFIPSSAPVPPPTMALRKAKTGLNLLATKGGAQYQRQSLRSLPANTLLWYGNPDPVTYSMTITDFPSGATYGGFQAHIILAPDTGGGTAPDYADPNAILLDIHATAAGAANATFRYKTNQPTANSQMYSTSQGQLGTLNAPTALGTWSLTFQNNTNITLRGPGNTSLNLVMPPESAAFFNSAAPMMGTYFGIQPNNLGNIGQGVAMSEIKITYGSTVLVDDTFSTVDPTQQVDPALWNLRMDDPVGIFVITNQPSYWLSWSLPDVNFVLQARTNFTSAPFDPGWTNILTGNTRTILLNPSSLPDPKQTFFFMKK